MKIHIVSQGERSEGSRVKGVFDSIEKARAYAETIRVKMSADYTWLNEEWKEMAPDYWVLGCDYVDIRTHEVQ